MYHMMPDRLARYRRAVDEDATGRELETVVASLTRSTLEVHGTDPLKTVPRGFPRDHPRVEMFRYRGIIAAMRFPVAAWLGTAKAKTEVVKVLRTAAPLNDWLDANVGPSSEEEVRR
jgi:uncharacterized protein (DUF2461 family)